MFVEISLLEDRSQAEALTDALLETGALSASIEDADAGGVDEQPLYGEPGAEPPAPTWNRSRIVALFDASTDADAAVREALAAIGRDDPPSWNRRDVADENWVELTQAQFGPIEIGERLWIVPSWHEPPPRASAVDAIVVRLDPGMAFGTGDHATTRLCLAWLERHVVGGERVVDYGCGSGILAIAAARLGAATVVATDIDEQAVLAARRNAAANDVAVAVVAPGALPSAPADIVVANILSNPLKVLAPLLTSLVAPNGWLVLSGVLERQQRDVAGAYAPAILLTTWRADDGWVCLAGRRSDDTEG